MRMGERALLVASAMLLAAGTTKGTALAAPAQLRGKAVVVSWNEQRHQRSVATKQDKHINMPFSLTVYVSEKDQVFNRLSAGREGASDQAKGSKDRSSFASRAVNFSGARMTTTNTFISGGARQISVSFDPGFGSCSGSVVIGRSGGGNIVQSTLNEGAVELLSVTPGPVSCSISSGNPFAR